MQMRARSSCLQRRRLLLGTCLTGLLSVSPISKAAAPASANRTLILYFTWSGSSETVAKEVGRLTGGDLERIVVTDPYPDQYQETTERAKAERLSQARPAIMPLLHDPQDYDTIVIGHPIWGGTMPMAILTLCEGLRLSGKRLLHFTTHGGSGLGRSHEALRAQFPDCRLEKGLAVYGWGGVRDLSAVKKWLDELKPEAPRA